MSRASAGLRPIGSSTGSAAVASGFGTTSKSSSKRSAAASVRYDEPRQSMQTVLMPRCLACSQTMTPLQMMSPSPVVAPVTSTSSGPYVRQLGQRPVPQNRPITSRKSRRCQRERSIFQERTKRNPSAGGSGYGESSPFHVRPKARCHHRSLTGFSAPIDEPNQMEDHLKSGGKAMTSCSQRTYAASVHTGGKLAGSTRKMRPPHAIRRRVRSEERRGSAKLSYPIDMFQLYIHTVLGTFHRMQVQYCTAPSPPSRRTSSAPPSPTRSAPPTGRAPSAPPSSNACSGLLGRYIV